MKKIGELKFWLKQALWFVPCAYAANFAYAVYSKETGGTFGDTFGAANALFSGTALLMLVLAVLLQREELEQVKEERNDTRKLLEGQEDLNYLQSQALNRQLFEQSFGIILNAVFAEREIVTREFVANNLRHKSDLVEAGAHAKTILGKLAPNNSLTKDVSSFIDGPGDLIVKKCSVLLGTLITAADFVETAPIDESVKEAKRNLISPLFQEDVVHCLAWALCKEPFEDTSSEVSKSVFVNYNLSKLIGADQLNGFAEVRADMLPPKT